MLEGRFFIDRDGKHFSYILQYMRDQSVVLPETKKEMRELLAEAKFYQIQSLEKAIESALKQIKGSSLNEHQVKVENSLEKIAKWCAYNYQSLNISGCVGVERI
uniref:Potassium channel tetramerisation-type BTB domain-containing protein n=1 Tax=Elphidium margaritaceum TaxID=933848 RepID=A0A6T9ZCE5_9EUKA|mmetsp:Transcript_82/g.119  ORF Transcript_82/g.119 Transcript_82/m.119 type:complete len:104 (+) Transcript_82:3-314(+)